MESAICSVDWCYLAGSLYFEGDRKEVNWRNPGLEFRNFTGV